jgi:hypothetical protein
MQFCYSNNTDDQTDKLRTSFTSAVVTGARLQLAFESKLTVSALQADEQRCEADIFSSSSNTRQILHVARMHGLRWTKTMPAEEALRGQWQLLQWLRMCGCPWDTELILENAVRGGCLQTLRWLKANTRPWTNKTKEGLLWTACCFGESSAAQWLRNEGAPWPNGFCSRADLKDEVTAVCWAVPIAAWALANGCTWGTWQCDSYTARHYAEHLPWRQEAARLFEWAHSNGCPCTCYTAAAGAGAQ